jgi:hypothetical protein
VYLCITTRLFKTNTTDTHKNGSPQYQQQSVTVILNGHSSWCLSPLHLVHFLLQANMITISNSITGPRFVLVGLWYLLTARPGQTLPKFVAFMGLFRTFTCGGWTYVTSTDDHNWHDIFMISYLVATLPWTLGCLALSPNNARAVKYRKYLASAFFGTLVPLVYFFIQHKVHKVPGGKFCRFPRSTIC